MSDTQSAAKKAGRKPTRKAFSDEAKRIGERVRAARGDKPLTEVEKDLDISNQALSKIENGRNNPHDARSRRTLRTLAGYYHDDFGVDWLTSFAMSAHSPQHRTMQPPPVIEPTQQSVVVFHGEQAKNLTPSQQEKVNRIARRARAARHAENESRLRRRK